MIRLREFVKDNNIKQKELQNILQVSQPYISAVISGKMALPKDKEELLVNHYGDKIKTYIEVGDVVELKEGETVTLVPLIPIASQGGTLNEFACAVHKFDCDKIASPIKGVDFGITVSGDSMEPEYPNGSIVFIQKINEKAFIEWGRAYVLDTCNGVVIKLLVPSEKENHVRCKSINSVHYAPFDVSFDDIYGIYKVRLCMTLK